MDSGSSLESFPFADDVPLGGSIDLSDENETGDDDSLKGSISYMNENKIHIKINELSKIQENLQNDLLQLKQMLQVKRMSRKEDRNSD